jgi:uncharacterized membrane protein YdjX (TVP38/TMEM64 family)
MNDIKMMFNKTHIQKFIIVLAAAVIIWYWRNPLLNLISIIGDRDRIIEYIQGFGPWGPIVLFLILGAQVFLAVIPGHAFMVAGGYVYGLAVGSLITQLSTVITSQLAYLLARRYGRPFVNRMAPAHVIDRWNGLAERQGGIFFFFSFILPIFPSDLMCSIAGLTSISSRKFFVANFFGRLPCAIFITLIGSHGVEMPLQFWAVVVTIIVGLCVSWKKISAGLDQRILTNRQAATC